MDDESLKRPAVTVAEIQPYDDASLFEIRAQSTTPPVKEFLNPQSTASDLTIEVEHFRLSYEILNVLEKYGRHVNTKASSNESIVGTGSESPAWIGKYKFLTHVSHYVRQTKPVQLTLPAFPCKSVC